jgi:16S rRNA (cytosine1402-N4)-methyltransferase
MAFTHIPVLFAEAMEGLAIKPSGIYLDATFGRGGHSRGILERLGPEGRLYAVDRDPEAIAAAAGIKDPRFAIAHAEFADLGRICEDFGIAGKVDGILMDIGVSSPQLDDASRGFSFERDGPLDMRMDPEGGRTAADIVNTAGRDELKRIFRDYGEERFAAKVAAAIVRDREKEPFSTTRQLASLIARVVPGPEQGGRNKATRCFQALRIAVNGELDELSAALEQSAGVLAKGGRLCVISFHSLEDRIVKNFIKKSSRGTEFPKGLPVTAEAAEKMRLATATMEPVGGPVKASAEECAANARSRSATLRVARRL